MSNQKKILTFCCENSAKLALNAIPEKELTGLEIVNLPCSGKIEIATILNSLVEDYVAVLVLACPPDSCQYIRGSQRARQRIEFVQQRLQEIGLPPERVKLEFVSRVDTAKIARIIKQLKQEINLTEG